MWPGSQVSCLCWTWFSGIIIFLIFHNTSAEMSCIEESAHLNCPFFSPWHCPLLSIFYPQWPKSIVQPSLTTSMTFIQYLKLFHWLKQSGFLYPSIYFITACFWKVPILSRFLYFLSCLFLHPKPMLSMLLLNKGWTVFVLIPVSSLTILFFVSCTKFINPTLQNLKAYSLGLCPL